MCEFRDLPAGRYSLSVNRSGYLRLAYGQRRPLEPGKPIELVEGQTLEKVDFSLPRMSIISGRVTDDVGEPIADVQVVAFQMRYFGGRRQLAMSSFGNQTDETGQYRLTGLAPGDYYVMATTRETWTNDAGGAKQTLAFVPTYHPGTALQPEARRVRVSTAQETSGIDIGLIAGRAVSISGTAVDASGRALAGEFLMMMQVFSGPMSVTSTVGGGARVEKDGTFIIRDLPPGEYRVQVRAPVEPGKSPETASAPVTLAGEGVSGITLVTSVGGRVLGRVVMDDGSMPSFEPVRMTVRARSVKQEPPFIGPFDPTSGRVKDDWTFT